MPRWFWLVVLAWTTGASRPEAARAQFDEIPVPEEARRLDFMLGEWTVRGRFRTPDFVSGDRRLWYRTRGGGVTAFDGRAWTAVPPSSPEADSILGRIEGAGQPYEFENGLTVRWIQDDFVLLADEGRTSGTTSFYYDAEAGTLVALALHAPTGSVTTSSAPADADGLVFTGRGTDRRGERIFVRTYELLDADHFRIRTAVSFDEGKTWIQDQIVQEVARR